MSLKVVIPTPLRKFTSGAEVVEVDAATVKEVLDNLDSKFPGFGASVCDEAGSLLSVKPATARVLAFKARAALRPLLEQRDE